MNFFCSLGGGRGGEGKEGKGREGGTKIFRTFSMKIITAKN